MEDITIVPSSLPFLWQGKHYKIGDTGIKNDIPYASVEPHDPKLVAELIRRIKKEKALSLHLCNGYVCFDEDYRKMLAKLHEGQ